MCWTTVHLIYCICSIHSPNPTPQFSLFPWRDVHRARQDDPHFLTCWLQNGSLAHSRFHSLSVPRRKRNKKGGLFYVLRVACEDGQWAFEVWCNPKTRRRRRKKSSRKERSWPVSPVWTSDFFDFFFFWRGVIVTFTKKCLSGTLASRGQLGCISKYWSITTLSGCM